MRPFCLLLATTLVSVFSPVTTGLRGQIPGLVARYEFEGTSLDTSGNGNHGMLQGSPLPVFAAGRYGLGLQLPGVVGSHVEVPPSPRLAPSSAVTISCWFLLTRFPTTYSALIYKAGAPPTSVGFVDRSYSLWAANRNGHNFGVAATATNATAQTGCDVAGNHYGFGEWTHVAAVVDVSAQKIEIWVNGVLAQSCGFAGPALLAGSYPLRIGGPFPTLGDQSALAGVIDDVRIYDRALSPYEVMSLMHPTGVRQFGGSSPGCSGPLGIAVSSIPRVGNAGFALSCNAAPPLTVGHLAFAAQGLTTPIRVLGADLWIDPNSGFTVSPLPSTTQGIAAVLVPVPNVPALSGMVVAAQFLWLGPTTPFPCPVGGISATAGLSITVQP